MRSVLVVFILFVLPALAFPDQAVPAAVHQQALSSFRDGQVALGREDLPGAERAFKAALVAEPGLVIARFALGQTYLAARRYPDALDAFAAAKRAIEQENRAASSGRSAGEQRRRDEIRELRDSLRLLQSATTKDPNPITMSKIEERIRVLEQDQGKAATGTLGVPAEYSFALGTAHLRLGNPQAAEAELREALRVRPGYGEAHNNLAVALAQQARWAEAGAEVALAEKAGSPVPAGLKADIQAQKPVPVTAAASGDPTLAIAHESIGCVAAGTHPRISARITPADSVSRARVRFRSAGAGDWYTVAMERDDDAFVAVLPPPRKGLAGFQYEIEATSTALDTQRSPQAEPIVRARPEDCLGQHPAEYAATSMALVDAPAGAPALPPGFDEPRRPNAPRAHRAGVFGLGPYPSLGLGLGVLAGSFAIGSSVAHQPTNTLDISLAGSEPPAGARVQGRGASITVRFRIEPHRDFEGTLEAHLRPRANPNQGFTFAPCTLLVSPATTFRAGQSVTVAATGPAAGCIAVGRTDLVDVEIFDPSRVSVFTTHEPSRILGPGQSTVSPFELVYTFSE